VTHAGGCSWRNPKVRTATVRELTNATTSTGRVGYSAAVPENPLAYFITFRCYGTWLPGDARGSERWRDKPGDPFLLPNRGIAGSARSRMRHTPITLDAPKRLCVEATVRRVCEHRAWALSAINVRTNHVHLVVSGAESPERIMNALKSWSTRDLRSAGLLGTDVTPWSQHGSTRYLWDEAQVDSACTYVLEAQDRPGID
jgi:REP element-mobilizing transposase RayT